MLWLNVEIKEETIMSDGTRVFKRNAAIKRAAENCLAAYLREVDKFSKDFVNSSTMAELLGLQTLKREIEKELLFLSGKGEGY